MGNQYLKESTKMGPAVFYWFFLILILGFVGWKWVYPAVLDFQREAVQHSHEYVETKRSLLLDLQNDWEQLDVEILETSIPAVREGKLAQQAGILRQMKEEAQRIENSGDIPQSVKLFLAQH